MSWPGDLPVFLFTPFMTGREKEGTGLIAQLLRMPHYSIPSFIVKMPRFREDAFLGLESLEWLKLEDNSLTTLGGDELFPKTMKVKNSDILPSSYQHFQGIEIHNNPWSCDCLLQEFTRWVHLTAVPRVAEPKCHQPPRLQVPPLLIPSFMVDAVLTSEMN